MEYKMPRKETDEVLFQPVSWTGRRQRKADLWENVLTCLKGYPLLALNLPEVVAISDLFEFSFLF